MDFDTMKAVGDNPGFTTSETVTLLCLAWHHNESTGFAWPSVPAIAAWTGLAVNTIRPTLRTLESAGCIHRTDRAGTSPQYRLDRAAITAYTPTKIGRGRTPTKIGTTKTVTPTKIGSTPPPELGGAPLPKLGDEILIQSNEILSNGVKPAQRSLTHEDLPEWVQVFIAEKRFSKPPAASWIATIEAEYTQVNLVLAAHSCLEWLQTDTRGKRYKGFKKTFDTWLRNRKNDGANGFNSGGYAPRGRKEPTTDSAELAKDPW